MAFDTSPAISTDMTFDEVVQRLTQRDIVYALIAIGTSRAGLLTPASD